MNLNINDYSGPLDVLLHMVKKHEMDIYDIDIKLIIDEYLTFISSVESTDLDSKSEYLIMASELIHLKSKLLLGFDDEEDDENYEINSEEDLTFLKATTFSGIQICLSVVSIKILLLSYV